MATKSISRVKVVDILQLILESQLANICEVILERLIAV